MKSARFRTFTFALAALFQTTLATAAVDDALVQYAIETYSVFAKENADGGTNEAFEAFLKEQGIANGVLRQTLDVVRKHHKQGEEIGHAKTKERITADLKGAPPPAAEPPKKEESKKELSTAEISTAKKQLFADGLDAFRRLSTDVKLYVRETNGMGASIWDLPLATLEEATTTPDYSEANYLHRFLARYGLALATRKAVKDKKAIASGTEKAGQEIGGSPARLLPELSDESFFRDKGIAFTTGAGYAHTRDGGSMLSSVTVRWNLRQARATSGWNRMLGADNPYYAPMTFHGRVLYFENTRIPKARPAESTLDASVWNELHKPGNTAVTTYQIQTSLLREAVAETPGGSVFDPIMKSFPPLTFNGPLIGGAVSGEKIEFSAGKEERPYLVGWSFGFGYSDHAASLLYLDFAALVSPDSGFRQARPYVGISLDGELFGKIIDFIRNGKKPTSTPW